jgi:hypothetical protein
VEYQKSWWHLEIVIYNNFFACSFSVLSNLLHKSFIDDILHTTHQTAIPTFFTIAEFK